MKIVEIETGLSNIRGSDVDAELFEDIDSQTLETDVVHHVELGWLVLENVKWSDSCSISGTECGSMIEELGEDGNTVVLLQHSHIIREGFIYQFIHINKARCPPFYNAFLNYNFCARGKKISSSRMNTY